ncbi:MAG: hypothetical protein WDN06_22825 [Asticcacaulis sp.]
MDEEIKKDKDAILKEAEGLLSPSRRRLLGNVLTLGGLSLAAGVAPARLRLGQGNPETDFALQRRRPGRAVQPA